MATSSTGDLGLASIDNTAIQGFRRRGDDDTDKISHDRTTDERRSLLKGDKEGTGDVFVAFGVRAVVTSGTCKAEAEAEAGDLVSAVRLT